jgi:hypothetical protein
MLAAGRAAVARMEEGEQDIEIEAMSHAAADVIFRTLFSIPIEDAIAAEVFSEFRAYQRTPADPEPARLRALAALDAARAPGADEARARRIRALITELTSAPRWPRSRRARRPTIWRPRS